jgi:hypothetical protein
MCAADVLARLDSRHRGSVLGLPEDLVHRQEALSHLHQPTPVVSAMTDGSR